MLRNSVCAVWSPEAPGGMPCLLLGLVQCLFVSPAAVWELEEQLGAGTRVLCAPMFPRGVHWENRLWKWVTTCQRVILASVLVVVGGVPAAWNRT